MTTALPKLETLKPNNNWAKLPLFNRKNWTRVRFGEVVENLNETCDPAEAGLERVIAMEHGRIVEQGSPAALVEADGAFARWVRASLASVTM